MAVVENLVPADRPVYLLGMSFGGCVVVHCAATNPDRINGKNGFFLLVLRRSSAFRCAHDLSRGVWPWKTTGVVYSSHKTSEVAVLRHPRHSG